MNAATFLGELLARGMGFRVGEREWSENTVSWAAVYRLAASHGVLAVAWDGLVSLPEAWQPPRELRLRWAYNVERIERRYVRQRQSATELAALYAAAGVRTVVLKGLAVAAWYPRPEHRPCGDLDCFLMGDYERGNRLAEEAGAEVACDFYKHSHIRFRGLTVENHQFCTAVRGSRRAKAFERHLQELLAAQPLRPLAGTSLLEPSPDFNALFLTHHALAHFLTEGISLRHVCDWAIFLEHEGRGVDWPAFRRVAARYDLLRFAEILSALAVHYLGLTENPLPAAEPLPVDRVWRSILCERRHLNDTAGSAWRKRFALLRNLWRDRWKYGAVCDRSLGDEVTRYVAGFLFDRRPHL